MRRAVALLLVVALVVTIVGLAELALHDRGQSGDATSVPTTTPAPGATDAPTPDLDRFYGQQLTWRSCRTHFLCSTLRVPLDYRHADGSTIGLALLKVPAADPARRLGSLVVNPGGPGASGTDYAAAAKEVFRTPLRAAYDVVGFDPRGVGDSDPVDCLTDRELDDYVAQDQDPDTPAEVSTYTGWVASIGRGCAQRSGAIAGHVTTVEAARDMDVLRAALGESTLTFFGASYGTKLGATYADLFPSRVGRMVLDGAMDLSLSPRELSLQQAAGFETALRAYVADCVGGQDCPIGDSVDAGLARIRQLLADVDAHPLPTRSGRELEAGNASYGITMPLYDKSYWPYLTQGLADAIKGDGTLLLAFSDAYTSRGPRGYTGNIIEANYAINCLDDPWSIPADQVPAQLPEFEKASPTFGSTFAWGLTLCGGLQEASSEKPRDVHAAGAPPIVVVGTTRDPATPYEWAVHLAKQLDSGVLVSRDGDGHTGYNSGNACVDDAVEGYLLRGTVPQDGLRC